MCRQEAKCLLCLMGTCVDRKFVQRTGLCFTAAHREQTTMSASVIASFIVLLRSNFHFCSILGCKWPQTALNGHFTDIQRDLKLFFDGTVEAFVRVLLGN